MCLVVGVHGVLGFKNNQRSHNSSYIHTSPAFVGSRYTYLEWRCPSLFCAYSTVSTMRTFAVTRYCMYASRASRTLFAVCCFPHPIPSHPTLKPCLTALFLTRCQRKTSLLCIVHCRRRKTGKIWRSRSEGRAALPCCTRGSSAASARECSRSSGEITSR